MVVEVWRRGFHGDSRAQHIDNASISVEFGHPRLMFLDDRGFGESMYTLRIASEHFRDLIEAMLRANAVEAVKAIGSALKDGIPDPVLGDGCRTILSRRKPTPEEREY